MNQGWQQPPQQMAPQCSRCGRPPYDGQFLSPQGHLLCRACFNANAQAQANVRANEGAFGAGMFYTGNERALDAGMAQDMDAKILRRCAKCQAPAVNVVHVTFHYVNGITRGRTYLHRCAHCNVEFKTESVLRMLTELFTGLVCALVGFSAIFFAEGWSWLLVLLAPAGLAFIGITLWRALARFRNPVIPRAPQ